MKEIQNCYSLGLKVQFCISDIDDKKVFERGDHLPSSLIADASDLSLMVLPKGIIQMKK